MMKISNEWDFGSDKEVADRLKGLVLSGKKTATTGIYSESAKIPKVGDYEAILGYDKKRFCILRCTNVEVKDFLDVDFSFIQKEGEGDKDIEEWRERHRRFFNIHDDDIKVICEEFEIVSQD